MAASIEHRVMTSAARLLIGPRRIDPRQARTLTFPAGSRYHGRIGSRGPQEGVGGSCMTARVSRLTLVTAMVISTIAADVVGALAADPTPVSTPAAASATAAATLSKDSGKQSVAASR